MKTMSLLIACTCLFLGACATKNHIYSADGKCISCWNNPITGKPINHDGKQDKSKPKEAKDDKKQQTANTSTKKKKGKKKYTQTFTVPVNVDIAFIKIKKEFDYQTEQEIRQEWGSLASMKLQTFAFAYDATPGVYYHMRAARDHKPYRVIIDSQIEKINAEKSKITQSYWIQTPNADPNVVMESIKARTLNALNN